VLAHAQAGRELVQDFMPLAESMEWELGQQYLRERGNKAFLSDASPVPYVVNNDGTLSRNAAQVFFASVEEADKKGELDADIYVLELGIGVGLFARYFLDHFQELCRRARKDYYDRLCYVAADRSERMLLDLLRNGILAGHPGRYCVRQVDALKPEERLPQEPSFRQLGGRPFQAVFLNYLLDCLPAAVLQIDGERVRHLCVRTCVARGIRLADHTDLTAAQLRERVARLPPYPNPSLPEARGAAQARQELLEAYGLLASEYDYQPVDPAKLPYGEFAVEFGRRCCKKLLLNYGAIACLEKLLQLLRPGGFILMNEYGFTQLDRDADFEHQRFSLTTAVGLNFPLLKAYFADGGRCQWLQAGGEARGICSRMIGHKVRFEADVRFHELFNDATHQRLQEPLLKARECIKVGRFEIARSFYEEAVHVQPQNWVLLGEVSQFLTYTIGKPKEGADIAKLALALNPRCSAELWNALGDAVFQAGRMGEAESAYRKALEINSSDVRARYNLAWVHARNRDYAEALAWIAQALALDKTGAYRDRLLQTQNEVLRNLAGKHQQEYLQMANLISRHAKPDGDKAKEGEEPPPPPIITERRE
jgi:tetratricopeptide (TPR) repeat protein